MQPPMIELVPQVADGAAIQAASGQRHFPQFMAMLSHPFAERKGEPALTAPGGFKDRGFLHGSVSSGLFPCPFTAGAGKAGGALDHPWSRYGTRTSIEWAMLNTSVSRRS